jgi:hypothetical protein
MGTANATVVLDIYEAEDGDWTDEDEAREGIRAAVEGCINNACEVFRNTTRISTIDVTEFIPGVKVARIRLTASAYVDVAYDPNSRDIQSWADDNVYALLIEHQDADWEAYVEDPDYSESPDNVAYDAESGDVTDLVESQRVQLFALREREREMSARLTRIRSRVGDAVFEGLVAEEVTEGGEDAHKA